jgi:hypothetical protein
MRHPRRGAAQHTVNNSSDASLFDNRTLSSAVCGLDLRQAAVHLVPHLQELIGAGLPVRRARAKRNKANADALMTFLRCVCVQADVEQWPAGLMEAARVDDVTLTRLVREARDAKLEMEKWYVHRRITIPSDERSKKPSVFGAPYFAALDRPFPSDAACMACEPPSDQEADLEDDDADLEDELSVADLPGAACRRSFSDGFGGAPWQRAGPGARVIPTVLFERNRTAYAVVAWLFESVGNTITDAAVCCAAHVSLAWLTSVNADTGTSRKALALGSAPGHHVRTQPRACVRDAATLPDAVCGCARACHTRFNSSFYHVICTRVHAASSEADANVVVAEELQTLFGVGELQSVCAGWAHNTLGWWPRRWYTVQLAVFDLVQLVEEELRAPDYNGDAVKLDWDKLLRAALTVRRAGHHDGDATPSDETRTSALVALVVGWMEHNTRPSPEGRHRTLENPFVRTTRALHRSFNQQHASLDETRLSSNECLISPSVPPGKKCVAPIAYSTFRAHVQNALRKEGMRTRLHKFFSDHNQNYVYKAIMQRMRVIREQRKEAYLKGDQGEMMRKTRELEAESAALEAAKLKFFEFRRFTSLLRSCADLMRQRALRDRLHEAAARIHTPTSLKYVPFNSVCDVLYMVGDEASAVWLPTQSESAATDDVASMKLNVTGFVAPRRANLAFLAAGLDSKDSDLFFDQVFLAATELLRGERVLIVQFDGGLANAKLTAQLAQKMKDARLAGLVHIRVNPRRCSKDLVDGRSTNAPAVTLSCWFVLTSRPRVAVLTMSTRSRFPLPPPPGTVSLAASPRLQGSKGRHPTHGAWTTSAPTCRAGLARGRALRVCASWTSTTWDATPSACTVSWTHAHAHIEHAQCARFILSRESGTNASERRVWLAVVHAQASELAVRQHGGRQARAHAPAAPRVSELCVHGRR